MEEIQDSALKELLHIKGDMPLTRAGYVVEAWHHFQRFFNDWGFFKDRDENGMKDLVQQFLTIRTHPEMQVFFTYLSPSGYINSWLEGEKR
ncbi:hypothetical protein A3A63_02885 [Candidatus Gottesmanbacteria bacterium RIFCSPLOWO2_01_FULL_46_9]|uniref:Uncharacterized protein n=1 Tax=Candidatus Gottesmanbacteria bacterium RIFCSPLOWO2_01_FULL_46_9 TaxID=1798394 RepID=A0A1F6B0R7_9BACT|nr:MAG: hypothetical protein A3A63_02885 [Candidatus Gottesmanbacteria bacterium RIFCSPLOWO2_01_FULL_46_9]